MCLCQGEIVFNRKSKGIKIVDKVRKFSVHSTFRAKRLLFFAGRLKEKSK